MTDEEINKVVIALHAYGVGPDMAPKVIGMARELEATKAIYHQLLDIINKPPREDLSGAFENLTRRFEEQLKLNEELSKQVAHPPMTDWLNEELPKQAAPDAREMSGWSIEALQLPKDTEEALKNSGIYSLGDLCKADRDTLFTNTSLGIKMINRIERVLGQHGLNLAKVTTSRGAAVS